MINAWDEALAITIQEGDPQEWRRVVDIGLESPDDIATNLHGEAIPSLEYRVGPRSVVVLVRAGSRET